MAVKKKNSTRRHRKWTQIGERGWQILNDRFCNIGVIAEVLNCSASLVWIRLNEYKIKMNRNWYPYRFMAKNEGYETEYDMFYDFYHGKNMTMEEIGQYLGGYIGKHYKLSKAGIRNKLKSLKIKIKSKGGSRNKNIDKIKLNYDKIVKLQGLENMKRGDICMETGLTPTQVNHCWLKYRFKYNRISGRGPQNKAVAVRTIGVKKESNGQGKKKRCSSVF